MSGMKTLIISLGLLCALTLVVVVSALHRMQLYQEAYGFTQARLVVDVFEGWLGVVVLAVALAGLVPWPADRDRVRGRDGRAQLA